VKLWLKTNSALLVMAGPCRLLVSPISVPPLMFQFWAPVPVNAQIEAPILLKMENPRYCCAGPMLLTLKMPSSVLAITGSPSWKVSLPVPSTLPLMVKPGASVSVNGPPVKLIAVPPPLIAPSLKTLPVPDMLIVPLTIPKLATVLCGLPVTVKA
jgi:hypothetical protein